MTYQSTVVSFIMTLVAGTAIWFTFLSHQSTHHAAPLKVRLPDAFMEDVTALILDKQGKPSLKIVTPKMTHFSLDDTTELVSPELTLYRKSQNPWRISALFGNAIGGIETLYFWQDVAISHAADDALPATLIKTQTLTVHPNKQLAETKDDITLIQPNLVIKSVGMLADMNIGDIKLLSQTRGDYVPNS